MTSDGTFEVIANKDGLLRLIHKGRVIHLTAYESGSIHIEVWNENASHTDSSDLHAVYRAEVRRPIAEAQGA